MSEHNKRTIEAFLSSKSGTAPATQSYYRERLTLLNSYLDRNKIDISKFKETDLTAFLTESYKKFSTKTMNHQKIVTVAFLKFTFPHDWFKRFPNLSTICKGQKVISRYKSSDMLSIEEVQRLIQKENNPFWKTAFSKNLLFLAE